jgi:hypothetical protein
MRRFPLSIVLLCALAGCAGTTTATSTAGGSQSVAQFCRSQDGASDAGRCVVERQAAFPNTHADDPGLHERAAALHHLRKKLYQSQERAKSIDHALAEARALLSVPDLAPAHRARLTIEVRQLTEQRLDLERSLARLEQEHAAAALEYDAQRRRIASQYRS